MSAGDAELDRIGLAHDASATDGAEDVEGLFDAGDAERTASGDALLRGDEVDVGFLLVDGELATAGTEEDAGDGGFTPAGSVVLDQICHGAP
jgi:hypothetical protein